MTGYFWPVHPTESIKANECIQECNWFDRKMF